MRLRTNRIDTNAGLGFREFLWFGLILILTIPFSTTAADEDAYLKQIENEALKVQTPGEELIDSQGASAAESDRGLFEKELERHYRGSYLFYKKLPQQSRNEIFREYERGASISDMRQEIMKHFLGSK